MRLVELLFIYIIASAQILAVGTYCANHHTQKGKRQVVPQKVFCLSLSHEIAAAHHQGGSLSALVSAEGRDDMNLDSIACAHLKESL